jgi:hypothetical protein
MPPPAPARAWATLSLCGRTGLDCDIMLHDGNSAQRLALHRGKCCAQSMVKGDCTFMAQLPGMPRSDVVGCQRATGVTRHELGAFVLCFTGLILLRLRCALPQGHDRCCRDSFAYKELQQYHSALTFDRAVVNDLRAAWIHHDFTDSIAQTGPSPFLAMSGF